MAKKLFECRVEVVTYVLAEDEFEAQEIGHEALREEAANLDGRDLDVSEVTTPRWKLAPGWGENSLVWGAETDTPLGEALKRVR